MLESNYLIQFNNFLIQVTSDIRGVRVRGLTKSSASKKSAKKKFVKNVKLISKVMLIAMSAY